MFTEIEMIMPEEDADPVLVLPDKPAHREISIFIEDKGLRFFAHNEEIGFIADLAWELLEIISEYQMLGCVYLKQEELVPCAMARVLDMR